MRQIRTVFCLFSFIAALAALAQHMGVELWGCATCSLVNDMPVSAWLAWGGPPALALLAYGSYIDHKWVKTVLPPVSLVSIGLLGWMVSHATVCTVCVLVHVGIIAAMLCLIPKAKVIGPLFFSLSVVFTATDGWDRVTKSGETAIFRPRNGETIPNGKVYVLFSDPECSRCQMVESQIAKLPKEPAILYRWTLLPQNMYRSMRAVATLEMARATSPKLFEDLRKEVLQTPPPLTDSVLRNAAKKHHLDISTWLESPNEAVTVAIEADQTTSQELKIESLPTLAELSPPDATGARTLRKVSFAEIGLKP